MYGTNPKQQPEKKLWDLLDCIYEDNATGRIADERFAIMSPNYEAEQKSLKKAVAMLRDEIEARDNKTSNVPAFLKRVIDGKTVYPIDIYYNGVGIITAPSAEEYEEMFQERLKQKCTKE